jgi:hypothetical protein
MQESSSSILENNSVLIINEINNTQTSKTGKSLITFMGLVDNQPAYILIDSGATNNYISDSFVKKYRLYTEPLAEPAEAALANGLSLSVIRMVPSIPIRIQDYKDEVNANVLALDKYDMVLSMAWLNTYSPTVDYRAKSLSFQHDGKTITLKPTPTDTNVHTQIVPSVNPEAIPTTEIIPSSVADNDISLIKDDQQLTVREGVPGAQSPHHYSTVNSVLYIVLLVVLLAVYLGYMCAEKIAVSRVGMDANETHMHTTQTSFVYTPLTHLLQSISYLSSTLTIIVISFGIYSFTSTPNIVYDYIRRKVKKARPR